MKHGGNIEQAAADFGYSPSEMLDLSTGISPASYPFGTIGDWWHDLPSIVAENRLKETMAAAWNVPSGAAIALAPGSSLAVALAPSLRPCAKDAALPNPVYSEHLEACKALKISRYDALEIPKNNSDLIIGVQPGNPLGNVLPPEMWLGTIERMAASGGLLVMDEAFIDVMPHQSLMPFAGKKGLLIIRSFGKFYGMAGVRLGAAIGHRDDIEVLKNRIGAWPVSGAALAIGQAALNDGNWAEAHRQWLKKQRRRLGAILAERGLEVCGGTDLFALVQLQDAQSLHQHLAENGIWTRRFEDYPRWLRLGLSKDKTDEQKIKTALEKYPLKKMATKKWQNEDK